MIWWQSKLHKGTEHIGKIFPSWFDFITVVRKQFYPLGYKEKYLTEWQGLKVRKGHSVQEYTNEFCKKALMLDIPLYTQENLMKDIGGLPEYVRNTVFMFSPTNLDEVVVQATYIEAGNLGVGVSSELIARMESKGKGNVKKVNFSKKEVEKYLF